MTTPTPASIISRRHTLFAAGILGLGATLARLPGQAPARAGAPYVPRGLTVETLCTGELATIPGSSLTMRRLGLQPGTVLPPHACPGAVALFVMSGAFGFELHAGHGSATQASTDGMWDVRSELAAGERVTLHGGDHIFLDAAARWLAGEEDVLYGGNHPFTAGTVQTMWNDGDEPVVLLISAFAETGAPEFLWINPD